MLLGTRALHCDMEHQILDRPFVMLIGATDVDSLRGTPLAIDQNVDFGAQFGAISRIFARLLPPSGAAHDRLSTACQRH